MTEDTPLITPIIYVLKLENDKYYVGKTSNLEARIEQHKNEQNCEWIIKYPFVSLLSSHNQTSIHDENNTALEMIETYGLDNVRGGFLCYMQVNIWQKTIIRRMLNSIYDRCYFCSKKDHFYKDCNLRHITYKLNPKK